MAVTITSAIPKTGVGRVLGVARAVGVRSKGMTRDAIADKLNIKAGTGSANNRVIAAKKFGVIEVGPSGGYVLTDLGRRLADPEPARDDIIAAIRNVAPFARIIDQAGGDPSNMKEADIRAGLEAAGVRAAELDSATRVFTASWNYRLPDALDAATGNQDAEPGPAEANGEEAAAIAGRPSSDTTARSGGGTRFLDHNVIRSVLAEAPAVGEPWPADRYEAWSELLRTTIRFVYPDTVRGE